MWAQCRDRTRANRFRSASGSPSERRAELITLPGLEYLLYTRSNLGKEQNMTHFRLISRCLVSPPSLPCSLNTPPPVLVERFQTPPELPFPKPR